MYSPRSFSFSSSRTRRVFKRCQRGWWHWKTSPTWFPPKRPICRKNKPSNAPKSDGVIPAAITIDDAYHQVAHKDPAEEVASGDEDLAAALEQGGDFDDGSDQEDPQEEVGDQTCTTGRHGYVIDDFIVSDASGNESLVEEDGEEEEEWETWEGEAGTQRQTRSPDVVERRTSSRQRTRALARGLAEREGQELVYSPRQGFRMTRRSQQSGVGGRRGVPVESTGRGEGVGVGSGGEGGRRGRGRDGVVDADESEEGWVLQNELRQLQRETGVCCCCATVHGVVVGNDG